MGITPTAAASSGPNEEDSAAEELLGRIRRRASEIRASWATEPGGTGDSVTEDADSGARTPSERTSSSSKPLTRRLVDAVEPQRLVSAPLQLPPAEATPPARPAAAKPSDTNEDLFATLNERGIEYIDFRAKRGALWVVGGSELSTLISDLGKRGYKFTRSPKGGRATNYQPGWFMK